MILNVFDVNVILNVSIGLSRFLFSSLVWNSNKTTSERWQLTGTSRVTQALFSVLNTSFVKIWMIYWNINAIRILCSSVLKPRLFVWVLVRVLEIAQKSSQVKRNRSNLDRTSTWLTWPSTHVSICPSSEFQIWYAKNSLMFSLLIFFAILFRSFHKYISFF